MLLADTFCAMAQHGTDGEDAGLWRLDEVRVGEPSEDVELETEDLCWKVLKFVVGHVKLREVVQIANSGRKELELVVAKGENTEILKLEEGTWKSRQGIGSEKMLSVAWRSRWSRYDPAERELSALIALLVRAKD